MRTVQRNQIADSAINTDKLEDDAVTTSKIADSSVSEAKLAPGLLQPYSSVRQTVQRAARNANQLPEWLTRTSNSTIATYSDGQDSVVSASQGFGNNSERIGVLAYNATALEWTFAVAAGATWYLYVDVAENGDLTAGKTNIAPVYTRSGVSFADYSASRNIFDINEMTMWAGNGVTAVKVWRVFVGEVTLDGSGFVQQASIVTYAYNGRYNGYTSAVTPLVLTTISAYHKLGMKASKARCVVECISSGDGTFSVGDVLEPMSVNSAHLMSHPVIIGEKVLVARFPTSWYARDLSTTSCLLTPAKWKYWFEAERGW